MNAPIICNKEQAEALATRDAISGVCRDAAFFGPNKGFWVTYQERHISLRRRIREKREAAQKDGVYKKIRRYRATIMAMHAELGTIAKVAEELPKRLGFRAHVSTVGRHIKRWGESR